MRNVQVQDLVSTLRSASGSCRLRITGNATEMPSLEEALHQNQSLRHLEVNCTSSAIAIALAVALKQSASIQSFTLDARGRSMGDSTGVALAEALKHSASIQSFTLDARGRTMGDGTGVALAEALKQSASIQSFALDASHSSMGDGTGVALADALKQSASIQSFTLHASHSSMGDGTGVALAEALASNFVVLAFEHTGLRSLPVSQIQPRLLRNSSVLAQWKVLAQLARCTAGCGFRSLTQSSFRRQLFSFAVPPAYAANTKSFAVACAILQEAPTPTDRLQEDQMMQHVACGAASGTGVLAAGASSCAMMDAVT